jgi:fatty-acid desaturase
MKIGIYNIFTTFWFLIMLACSGTLTYFSFSKNLYSGDAILIVKIVIAIISLIFICVLFYRLYKFRILIVNKNRFISIHPFMFKIITIDILHSKNVKWKNFSAFKGTIYRKVELKQGKNKIDISDLEFENFENLVISLNGNHNKDKITIEQAKSNNSMMIFNVILLSGFLVFLVINTSWKNIHNAELIFFLINIILLFASIKRVFNYRKFINTSQH